MPQNPGTQITPGKQRPQDLAILGGPVEFPEPLHVGRPNVGDKHLLLQKISDIIDRKCFTNDGPCVRELEQKIASLLGVRHCVAMCNGTVALEIAARALDIKGEVILPSFTFVATAHAFQWQEVTPVFCDVDPTTHNIDPGRIQSLITPRTSAVVGVHLWGRPCPTLELEEITRRNGLRLMFDAAHAFACGMHNRMVGTFGDAEVFSFHATKFFSTFEGGAVTTNDDKAAHTMRLMRNFGFSGYDHVTHIGTNGKMSEVCAAMGLVSLDSLDDFISVNRTNFRAYQRSLSHLRGITLITYDDLTRSNFQYIVIEVAEDIAGLTRDTLLRALHAENVLARRYFFPGCHSMEPYRSYFPNAGLLLPETRRLAQRVLVLPTGTSMTEDGIRRLCRIIRVALDAPQEVSRAVRQTDSIAS